MKRPALLLVLPILCACTTQQVNVPPPGPKPLAGTPEERFVRMGDAARSSGDSAGAITLYQQAMAADARNPVPLERLGRAFADTGDSGRAEQSFRAALVLDSGNEDARRGLGYALLQQGRGAEALTVLQPLARDSEDPRLLRNYGAALDVTGRSPEAQAIYRRALKLAPVDADLHGNLALSLAVTGDTDGALAEMRAATNSPAPQPWQTANAVLLLAFTGREEEARTLGRGTVGADATEALILRGRAARTAATAPERAAALGLVNAEKAQPVVPTATLRPVAAQAPVPAVSAPGAAPAAGLSPSP